MDEEPDDCSVAAAKFVGWVADREQHLDLFLRHENPSPVHTSAVRKLGLDDAAILELMAVVDLFSDLNKFNDGLQVEPDEKPWYG